MGLFCKNDVLCFPSFLNIIRKKSIKIFILTCIIEIEVHSHISHTRKYYSITYFHFHVTYHKVWKMKFSGFYVGNYLFSSTLKA